MHSSGLRSPISQIGSIPKNFMIDPMVDPMVPVDGERNAVTSAAKATMEIKCGRNVIVCTIFFTFESRNSFSMIARIIGAGKQKIND